MINRKLVIIALAAGFIATGCSDDDVSENVGQENTASPQVEETSEQEVVTEKVPEDDFLVAFEGPLTHVHGMGFINSEQGLYFATHYGLKIYKDGSWLETDGQLNDYMGFNAVDEGFYTSGHPGADSDLPNPIGIQRSSDGGRSLESLGLEGETDFHWMAAGYRSHDLFVMNSQANSKMDTGFYFSGNAGADWQQLEAQGIEGELLALAIHPDNSQFLAAASAEGVFLSQDGGTSFSRVTEDGEYGTAVHFTEDELYYASYGSEAALQSYNLEGDESRSLELPELEKDSAVYIAVNPSDQNEITFYTVQGDAYISNDGGETWEEILNEGQILS